MSSRSTILGAITDGKAGEIPASWPSPKLDGDLLLRFTSELETLGAEVVTPDRLKELAGLTVFADEDVPGAILAGLERVDEVWDAEVGVTTADFGIADTGSLVLSAAPGRRRLASLAPPHHIAVLSKRNILGCAEEAVVALSGRATVFITGPSRTADIEGVIVRGIHGPRRLWVLVTE